MCPVRRGRGAHSNASGRYEPLAKIAFDDGWRTLEDLPPFATTVTARDDGGTWRLDGFKPSVPAGHVAAAVEWVGRFSCVADALQQLDAPSTARARERLLQTLGAHATKDGVWFDSRAWIVTARRR